MEKVEALAEAKNQAEKNGWAERWREWKYFLISILKLIFLINNNNIHIHFQ